MYMAPVNLNDPNFLKAKHALTNPIYKSITKSTTTLPILNNFLERNKEEIEKNRYKPESTRARITRVNITPKHGRSTYKDHSAVPESQRIHIDRHLIAAIHAILKIAKQEHNEEIKKLFTNAIGKLEKINNTNAGTHDWLIRSYGDIKSDTPFSYNTTPVPSSYDSSPVPSSYDSSPVPHTSPVPSLDYPFSYDNNLPSSYYPSRKGGSKKRKTRKNRKTAKR
jgi:hypothetical protein